MKWIVEWTYRDAKHKREYIDYNEAMFDYNLLMKTRKQPIITEVR